MKTEIIDIITKANFDDKFIEYVKDNLEDDFKVLYDQPYHRDMFKNPLEKHSAELKMWNSLVELVHLKNFYLEKGIDLEIFYKTINDLNYRIMRYYQNHQAYGLSVRDLYWLGFLFRAEIFDLVSLRFQRFLLSYQEIERSGYDRMELSKEWKSKLIEKMPIVNVHILNGADIRPEKIDESFALAKTFFAKYFSEHKYQIFACRTWMIYPDTLKLLNPNSNIVKFAQRFKIIATHNDPTQALDRIYGTTSLEIIKKLDHKSSLAKQAYKNLDKLGVGFGIIYK